LRFGPFELDVRTEELRRGDVPVKLQPQPVRVLALLASHPGRLVTREELHRAVWDQATYVDFEQGLNFCISRIRAALRDQADTPRFIETLPRRGYRFIGAVERTPSAGNVTTLALAHDGQATATARNATHDLLRAAPEPATDEAAPELPAQSLPVPRSASRTRWRARLAGLHALFTLGLLVWLLWQHWRAPAAAPPQEWRRITFRRGDVLAARFGPAGEVVYAANWTDPPSLYVAQPAQPEGRAVGVDGIDVVGVSARGEIGFMRRDPTTGLAVLARVPAGGGAIKDVLPNVWAADWTPDGLDFAVARRHPERGPGIEYPIGKCLAPALFTSRLRISPDGARVATVQHPKWGDDRGSVSVYDRNGRETTLGGMWSSIEGLAWSPRGDEVWVTASRAGADLGLWALSLDGRVRALLPAAGRLVLHDIARDGSVLLERGHARAEMHLVDQQGHERDLSWLDFSGPAGFSHDGRYLLFNETGQGGGVDYTTYAYDLEAASGVPVRVGRGLGTDISRDGRFVAAVPVSRPEHIELLPLGMGERREVRHEGIVAYGDPYLFPDGQRLLFTGVDAQQRARIYVGDVTGGRPRMLAAQTGLPLWLNPITDDGQAFVAPCGSGRDLCRHTLGGEEPVPIPNTTGARLVGFATGGQAAFVTRGTAFPLTVERLDLASGQSRPWMTLQAGSAAGASGVLATRVSRDGRRVAYAFLRTLSDAFVVSGLR
jgi:DNA-binding winged helix-turn-helix (wHTH) protein